MQHGAHYFVNKLAIFLQIQFLRAMEIEGLWVLGM